jgi:hypothetical protein
MAGPVFSQAVQTRRFGISVADAFLATLRAFGRFPPPMGAIECVLVGQTAPTVRTFDPPRRFHTMRHAGGFLTADGSWSVPGEPGRPLGPGAYLAEIRGEFYRPFPFQLTWPLPPNDSRIAAGPTGTAALLPAPSYPLPDVTTTRFQLGPTIIRGCFLEEDGAPVAGVGVEALNLLPFLIPPELPALVDWPFLRTETNAAGDWAILLPGRRYLDPSPEIVPLGSPPLQKNITVRFSLSGGPLDVVVPVTLATDHSLRNTALRGRVTGRGGRPITGAAISTTLGARQSISRENGTWLLVYDLTQLTTAGVTVTATLPDGRTASAAGIAVMRQATITVPTLEFP